MSDQAIGTPEPCSTKLLGGRVICRQPKKGFRVAIDPVLLAAMVPAIDGERVLDVGTGTAAAALCLAARVPMVRVDGIERQTPIVALARDSVVDNAFQDRVRIFTADILKPPADMTTGAYDHVMANPPYIKAGTGRPPPDLAKAAATVEGPAALGDWITFCAHSVRDGGTINIVHRADRLDDVIEEFANLNDRGVLIGAIVVLSLAPKAGTSPKRVLVQARKGSREAFSTLPEFILHNSDGAFTIAAERILRDAEPLVLSVA